MNHPLIVGVGGFASDVGKTTLMCQLLRHLPGWEAIKTTRGHYRSCGKDPHACCVSHLLSDEPVILSGRERTYAHAKDTGCYWDAGASNVHWMIVTDAQVEKGINQTLDLVRSGGVVIEGNSFAHFVDLDYFVMVARGDDFKIKSSARKAIGKVSAFYLSDDADPDVFKDRLNRLGLAESTTVPVYTPAMLPQLIAEVCRTSAVLT
jgi:molybdopterin-guanine dinucleotide biosynthesis protein